jgi:hypothetical protein
MIKDFDIISHLGRPPSRCCVLPGVRHCTRRPVHIPGRMWRLHMGRILAGRSHHYQVPARAGYVVALLDGAGLSYTTSYQSTTQHKPRRKRGGVLATLKGLW